ncbi:MAG: hypothetical protein FWD78_01120 [Treponema sp.]|nr:hypothetical protein [Treponema sp.]
MDKKIFFDRGRMNYFPLRQRFSKVDITNAAVLPEKIKGLHERQTLPDLDEKVRPLAAQILAAKKNKSSVICTFGAHAIKNGLGPLLGDMLERGWFTHLASNGAAIIHDWEFSWLGRSSEDVRENAAAGRFGAWEETGLYINLALACGAWQGFGYAASVGKMIADGGIKIPDKRELNEPPTAAAMDLSELIESLGLEPGFIAIPHPFKKYSLLAAAFEAGKPFTCHPMFGHDIIYTHKANRGAVIGRTAERDFLEFVSSVENLEGGVYLSVGSAVMSPMIFEKALSMARNAVIAEGGPAEPIRNCGIYVVDLQHSAWDWSKGEPPMENPAYYLRYMKTFNRMGCRAEYITADNRDFLISLYNTLDKMDRQGGL